MDSVWKVPRLLSANMLTSESTLPLVSDRNALYDQLQQRGGSTLVQSVNGKTHLYLRSTVPLYFRELRSDDGGCLRRQTWSRRLGLL